MIQTQGLLAPLDATTKQTIRFSFDRQPISATSQDTVSSALISAGHLTTSRSSKYRRPRGPFCLTGNCGTCLVRINGQPNLRACLTAVEDGMEVESQNQQSIVGPFEVVDAVMTKGMDHHHFLVKPRWVNQIMQQTARALVGFGSLPSKVSIEEQKQIQYQHHDVDVLVIGAGLSGREVATALEAAHMRVVTFDRRDLFDLTSQSPAPLPKQLFTQTGIFAAYPHEIYCEYGSRQTGLWAAATHPLVTSPKLHTIRPHHVVLATGFHEQQLLIPNNDLPGVFSARGLLHMLRRTRTKLTQACVVIGEGPESQMYANEIQATHIEFRDVKRILGRTRVRAVETHDQRIPCAIVALATSPSPAYELAAQAELAIRWNGSGYAVECTDEGRCKFKNPHATTSPPWTVWACDTIQGQQLALNILHSLAMEPAPHA